MKNVIELSLDFQGHGGSYISWSFVLPTARCEVVNMVSATTYASVSGHRMEVKVIKFWVTFEKKIKSFFRFVGNTARGSYCRIRRQVYSGYLVGLRIGATCAI